MNQERFRTLAEQHLCGALNDAEAEELCDALHGSLDFRGQLREQAAMNVMLQRRFHRRDDFVSERVRAALRDPAQKAGVVTRIMLKLEAKKKRRATLLLPAPAIFTTSKHRRFYIAMTSAAALFAVALTAYLSFRNAHSIASSDNAAFVAGAAQKNAAVARLESGAATLKRNGISQPLENGFALLPLDELAAGENTSLILEYSDGTSIKMLSGSSLTLGPSEIKDLANIAIALARGSIEASVMPQPEGKALMITTMHARATAAGARFQLSASAAESKLSVTEGVVKFDSMLKDESVLVKKNESAVADSGLRMEPSP
jgi:ferric-dicitrate binding protein FerR (iron transport regulator)